MFLEDWELAYLREAELEIELEAELEAELDEYSWKRVMYDDFAQEFSS